jgi:4-oxalocrotonate tautomerase
MPLAQIHMWKGRSKEQKDNLIKEVTDAICKTIDCPSHAVQIIINEVEKEDWGIDGKNCLEG